MAQNASWEWLLRGFKIDLETQLKPKTVKDCCDHVSYFARWVQRDENSRWHHYFPLKRFFAWAVNEGYLEQNPTDGIVLKLPKTAPIDP